MVTAFLLLIAASFFATLSTAAPADKKNIWAISIFRGPAPSPEEGPPASAHALRDPSKLKFEVIGIVGALLVWLVASFVGVFIVRKRLQRAQEIEERRREMMSIKPTGMVTLREIEAGPKSPHAMLSPKSPGKMSSIRSWARGHKGRESAASLSTVNTRIDERIVEGDRAKNMDDMAKLYAAVMAHDAERATNKSLSSADSSPADNVPPTPRYPYDNGPPTPQYANVPPTPQYANVPPTPKYYNASIPPTPRTPRSPRSPRSPRVPPEIAHPAYHPPMPQHQHFPEEVYDSMPPQSMSQNQPYPEEVYDPMPPPTVPESDESSLLEGQSTPRKSKPAALSFITNPSTRLGSSQSNKKRPGAITVGGQPISKPLGSADLRQSAHPSQISLPYSPRPPPPTPGKTPKVEEFEMHGRPQLTQLAINNDSVDTVSSKPLPFRQFYKDPLKSAPATKTTFLDRRQSAFAGGAKTGVPKTPYSPYCPQTPMAPVTPRRLLTKQEIKQNKKQYAMDVVQENEMVKNDDDMWGS